MLNQFMGPCIFTMATVQDEPRADNEESEADSEKDRPQAAPRFAHYRQWQRTLCRLTWSVIVTSLQLTHQSE